MAGGKPQVLQALGFQQIVNPGTATSLTVPGGARYALFSVEGANGIRIRADGTDPTSTIGILFTANDGPFFWPGDLQSVEVIAGGAAGTLNVQYFA